MSAGHGCSRVGIRRTMVFPACISEAKPILRAPRQSGRARPNRLGAHNIGFVAKHPRREHYFSRRAPMLGRHVSAEIPDDPSSGLRASNARPRDRPPLKSSPDAPTALVPVLALALQWSNNGTVVLLGGLFSTIGDRSSTSPIPKVSAVHTSAAAAWRKAVARACGGALLACMRWRTPPLLPNLFCPAHGGSLRPLVRPGPRRAMRDGAGHAPARRPAAVNGATRAGRAVRNTLRDKCGKPQVRDADCLASARPG